MITVNAEMLMTALTNPFLAEVIKRADLLLADSIAVVLALYLFGIRVHRITGVDFAIDVAVELHKKGLRGVAIFGGRDEATVKNAGNFMTNQGVNILVSERGPIFDASDSKCADTKFFDILSQKKPSAVFVGFGHGKQEAWISCMRQKVSHPCVWIGVGGAIDYWGGRVKRAPCLFQKCGLEWMWRLCLEPSRWRRIVTAIFVFPARLLYDAASAMYDN